MKVIATDADQENTLHSQIYYRIDEQSNAAGMFLISTATGEIMVRQNTLDREVRHCTETLTFPEILCRVQLILIIVRSAPRGEFYHHTMHTFSISSYFGK